MFGKCPNCGAAFKKSELVKLKYHMEAYKDESKYTKCHRCGRFFVTNIVFSLLFVVISFFAGISSLICSFILNHIYLGGILGCIGTCLALFKGQIHQYMPVVDVSETGL